MNIKLSVIIPVFNQEKLIERSIDSIPNSSDIEVIIRDDGSTDNTVKAIEKYLKESNNKRSIKLLISDKNFGVSNAINRALKEVKGEYTVLLGSDDYLLPEFNQVIEYLDGTDLIYFNLRTNSGWVIELNDETKNKYVGSVKCMRSDFIKGLKNDESLIYAEDWVFYQELKKRNPTEKFTDIVAKHYNWPREGSLSWNANQK